MQEIIDESLKQKFKATPHNVLRCEKNKKITPKIRKKTKKLLLFLRKCGMIYGYEKYDVRALSDVRR